MGRTVSQNKKARHDYFIEDSFETGIVLKGTEVKSIRLGKASIKEAYAELKNGEVHVVGMHVSPYEHGNIYNVDPLRKRKLLLHKREIRKLERKLKQDSLTLIPLSLYINDKGLVKVNLAVCKGKKKYDKRDAIQKRDSDMRIKREIKNRNFRN